MTARTHYLPFFTVNGPNGTQQAVCGEFVTAAQLAPAETVPTCYGCRFWVENLDAISGPDPAPVIGLITPEMPWGEARRTA